MYCFAKLNPGLNYEGGNMFEFVYPLFFLALPIPFLIMLLKKLDDKKIDNALKIPFYQGLKNELQTGKFQDVKNSHILLLFFIWCLMITALARPVIIAEPKPLEHHGHNIMLALDISASMSWADMSFRGKPISRIAVVKNAAREFVRERKLDKIGLILFGTRAYIMTPLTFDHENVLTRIDDATVGLAGNATSMGDALGLAVKRLKDNLNKDKIVILLTDGANTAGMLTPLKAAELARDNNIRVYTIGLGSSGSDQSLGGLLLNTSNDLDENTLTEIARITHGKYFRATDPKSLQNVYDTINKLETHPEQRESLRQMHELYPWFLGLALIMYFYWLIINTQIAKRKVHSFLHRNLTVREN